MEPWRSIMGTWAVRRLFRLFRVFRRFRSFDMVSLSVARISFSLLYCHEDMLPLQRDRTKPASRLACNFLLAYGRNHSEHHCRAAERVI